MDTKYALLCQVENELKNQACVVHFDCRGGGERIYVCVMIIKMIDILVIISLYRLSIQRGQEPNFVLDYG